MNRICVGIKTVVKGFFCFLLIPITYILISLILTSITVDREIENGTFDKTIYLGTNGVHLDIIIPKEHLDSILVSGLKRYGNEKYLSFGWGDENFYLNTPTWKDLTFDNAFRAMFLKSTTLMHVTRHHRRQSNWIAIKVNDSELENLNTYLHTSFKTNDDGLKIILENQGYSSFDDFYKATGSYSCFNTSNSWANKGFKESGLKSCYWTPFDFGLLKKYE